MRVGNMSHRQVLTTSKYPLSDRLELFDATVTPSLLCSSAHAAIVDVTADVEPKTRQRTGDGTTDQACLQLEPSNINQAKRIPNNDLTSDMTWLTTAEDNSK